MVVVIAKNVAQVKQPQEVETNTGKYIVYSSYPQSIICKVGEFPSSNLQDILHLFWLLGNL